MTEIDSYCKNHFGPKIEAEKDETLRQYLQGVAKRHYTLIFTFRPEASGHLQKSWNSRHPTKHIRSKTLADPSN